MAERQRLNIDFDSLFPGDTYAIGSHSVVLRPLGVRQLATVAMKLKGCGELLSSQGVTWDNYTEPGNIVKLASVLLDNFPEVLEEITNVAIEDIDRLPLEEVVGLLTKAIEVNLASKDKLVKNFESLTKNIAKIQK